MINNNNNNNDDDDNINSLSQPVGGGHVHPVAQLNEQSAAGQL